MVFRDAVGSSGIVKEEEEEAALHLAMDTPTLHPFSLVPKLVFVFVFVSMSMLASFGLGQGAGGGEKMDMVALLAVKKALLADPQQALTSWNDANSTATPCAWRGVLCVDGRVTNLQLPALGLTGPLSDEVGNLSELRSLSLWENHFSGSIPATLSRCLHLRVLQLQQNDFSGPLPTDLAALPELQVLNLAKNSLSGSIPPEFGRSGGLASLRSLDLSANHLSGSIPTGIASCANLSYLDLSANLFNGSIPAVFGLLPLLSYLSLARNGLSGAIPDSIGMLQSLQVLSLSNNTIGGSLPASLESCSSLTVLDVRGNSIEGVIPDGLFGLLHLQRLDLGVNNITGGIPLSISHSKSLKQIEIPLNNLNGSIPIDIGDLNQLQRLDLSGNALVGPIPESLGNVASLQYLDLSRNELEGSIPPSLAHRFDAKSFASNSLLCGAPMNAKCTSLREKHGSTRNAVIGVSVAGGTLLLFALVLAALLLKCKSNAVGGVGGAPSAEQKLVMFYSPITYSDVLEATGQFDEEHVLSRTRHGIVFKACLRDGAVLSVRRLPDAAPEEVALFRREAEMLGRVKHRNLAVLRGYYASGDTRLLIYDYMPNGNLAVLLQEASHQDGGHVLNWPMRHLIALGVARGLSFLHTQCDPPIVHGDVKPQHVQFDADFEAHLSDFGLERLVGAGPLDLSSRSSTPAGSLGYVPPETAATGRMAKEADVYSFGIVLLELLTGRRPAMFTQDEDIVKWVKRQLQTGQISELFDPNLLELDPESSEWDEYLLAVKVALLCTAPDPSDRPAMTEVVFMLEGFHVAAEMASSSDPTSHTSPA